MDRRRIDPRPAPAPPVGAGRAAVGDGVRLLRILDALWLLLVACLAPFVGIAFGSSCEGCPKVAIGLGLMWAGWAAVAALYVRSLRRDASPAYARATALLTAPLTVVVFAAGAVVAS